MKIKNIVIGITDCGKWKNYRYWIASENMKVLNLSSKENNLSDADKCDGIILSGGEDVHPRFYNKPEYLSFLDPKEINERRDEFELKVIEKTLKNKKPLLGICRGLQIANVYFGGTLIPDLPSINIRGHSKEHGYDQLHTVKVEDKTFLSRILGMVKNNSGTVNSAHHQAADKIGEELKVSARTDDGTIEAIELHESYHTEKEQKQYPFFLLVQWHPERMEKQKSPFAKNMKEKFLDECLTNNKIK